MPRAKYIYIGWDIMGGYIRWIGTVKYEIVAWLKKQTDLGNIRVIRRADGEQKPEHIHVYSNRELLDA